MRLLRRLAAAAALLPLCALAQTPQAAVLFKLTEYEQLNANSLQAVDHAVVGIVYFAEFVPVSTNVTFRSAAGPSFNATRFAANEYFVERSFSTEAAMNAFAPDGAYTIAVTGGTSASNTPLNVPTAASTQPVRFTNFDALRNWTENDLRVEWQPITGGGAFDYVKFSVERANGTEIYSTPDFGEPGALTPAATSATASGLSVAPREIIYAVLTYVRVNLDLVNNAQTGAGGGRGYMIRMPVQRAVPERPVIEVQPRSQTVAAGSTVAFNVNASGSALTYQWQRNGATLTGATNSTLVIPNVQSANAGTYTVVVTNAGGTATSAAASLALGTGGGQPGRIANLAIRSTAGTGAQTLIVGVTVGGSGTSGTKPLLVRGVGPALTAFGVSGALANPRLEIYSGATRVHENDNWSNNPDVISVSQQVGAFALSPATSLDAALYSQTFNSGSYSVQVSGVGSATGVALAEIYDATPTPQFSASTPRLINVAARTQVGTGGDILIAGFILSGDSPKTVLIRAVGPTLGSFGVAGTRADPKLELNSGSTVIHANDNWNGEASLSSTFSRVSAFTLPSSSRDAAMVVTLAPGNYTAQVSGVGATTGVALVEVYEVP